MYSIVHAIEINVVPYVNHSHIRAVAILQNAHIFKIRHLAATKLKGFMQQFCDCSQSHPHTILSTRLPAQFTKLQLETLFGVQLHNLCFS